MNIVNLQLKWACRIEYLASGFYISLSRRYRKKTEIAGTLDRFSRDEKKHGVMFGKAYFGETGSGLWTGPWEFTGKSLAFLQFAVPLRWKLKTLSLVESLALSLMKKELKSEKTNPYREILKKIEDDEVRHASFYASLYNRTVEKAVS
jgi:rubrerythrin